MRTSFSVDHRRVLTSFLTLVAFGFASFPLRAATVALYRFDTMADSTDDAGGEVLFDSSGNGLDLMRLSGFGSLLLSSGLPKSAPDNSLALSSFGAAEIDSPATDLFSVGRTGSLTIEFYYKPLQNSALSVLLAQEPGNNGWGIYQTAADASGKSALVFHLTNDVGLYQEVATPSIFSANGSWNHVAFAINPSGSVGIFSDGMIQVIGTGFLNIMPKTSTLRLSGENPGGNRGASFLMDDLRISDVSLPSGAGTGVGQLSWNASLSVSPSPGVRPSDFAHQWLKDHDFTIGAWEYTDHPELYAEANFNVGFSGRYESMNEAGIIPIALSAMTELNDANRTAINIALNSGVEAFLLRDEVSLSDVPGVRAAADYIRSLSSDALIIIGLGASSPGYVGQVIEGVQPDAVIHGFYPYAVGDDVTDEYWHRGGLTDIALIREQALSYDVPYFAYIQSFDDQVASQNPVDYRRRLPSESELRAELFSKLSAGYRGFCYFVFQDGPYEDAALIDPGGTKSALFGPAAEANLEVANLGRSLRALHSTDFRFLPGSEGETPEYMVDWSAGAGDHLHILGMGVDLGSAGNSGELKEGVAGFFTDENGQQYFMVTNLYHGRTLGAAGSSLDLFVQFDSTIVTLLRLNRMTGEPELIVLPSDHRLVMSLPGGTGDLYKYNDGMFAGILEGDANLDGVVDLADLSLLRENYGVTVGMRWARGDFDLDGDVDGEDLCLLATKYVNGFEQAFLDFENMASVPEPSPLGFAVFAVTVLWWIVGPMASKRRGLKDAMFMERHQFSEIRRRGL